MQCPFVVLCLFHSYTASVLGGFIISRDENVSDVCSSKCNGHLSLTVEVSFPSGYRRIREKKNDVMKKAKNKK